MADVSIINGYNVKDVTARATAESKYAKPSSGIPKTDLSSAVQTSLEKADTALQSANDAYLVTYGTTTFAQIDAAIAAGKQPVCYYNDIRYDYVGVSNGYHCFTAIITDTARRLYVKSTWGSASFTIAKTSDIPSEVTESTVAGWGFTKNTGTYSKPDGGIPKSDLASSVQTSLGLADTALQSYTETDPVFAASAAYGITSSDISSWNGKIDNPSSKSSGQVLTYNGSAWVAQNASGGMTGTTYTATIPYSSWTQSGDYYTKTVTVSGLKATYQVSPVVDCSLSGSDADGDNAILAAFGSLAIIDTAANSITVKAIGAAPEVNIPIIINVWE